LVIQNPVIQKISMISFSYLEIKIYLSARKIDEKKKEDLKGAKI
jgi:hypothetical protein